jgi:geranylgeranyl transferase type-2 subunit beta
MQIAAEKPRYLSNLAAQLRAGLEFLPNGFRSRHSEYLLAAQRPDGGFAGRQGGSDIYYTMFALRSAELLLPADEGLWRRAAQYARSLSAYSPAELRSAGPPRDMVECFCLLCIRRLAGERAGTGGNDEGGAAIMEAVRRLRAADGGYARFPGGEATVYHTFLAALCAELSGSDFSGAGEAAAFVLSRRCADGGYADSAKDGAEGATNTTAAALALLTLLATPEGLSNKAPVDRTSAIAAQAAEFLASMQRPEGGFAAWAGAPEPDLLSTFTASAALAGLGALGRVKLAPVARFAHRLQASAGGFRGCAGDAVPDVEYTYYGLGTLALLAQAAASWTPGPKGMAVALERNGLHD